MGEDRDQARLQAVELLEQLELSELQEKLPDEISGGQAQRVGIARAVVHKPMLVLAEEPTGQLDHATADHLFDLLLAFLDRGSSALLVATHDPLLAGRLQSQWRMAHGTLEVDR
jgi:putative ABC transport system ATP-binding protein/lipoprotein-releasing system ATP-binding protein